MLKAIYSKFKIPSHQNGHAYLTSHRICYVDNVEARKNSTAIELKEVEKYEFYVSCSSFLQLGPESHADIGRLPKIICKDHSVPKAAQEIVYSVSHAVKPIHPIFIDTNSVTQRSCIAFTLGP